MSFHEMVSPTEDLIEDARKGRMFILVDDEDRENEGDLVIPAQMATPEIINFMARYGRGLVCLALTRQRVEDLRLPLMPQHNTSRLQTAFTVSIEAREGVTTGISAADRAETIKVAIDLTKGPSDLVTPGHVFPLMARDGGVLVRTGHTEAAIDIARLANLNPAGVICEIMNDDGTMARRADLIAFAQLHGLKIGTIADLIAYRRRHERIIDRIVESELDSEFGGRFRTVVYVNRLNGTEHLALVKGDLAAGGPIPVRMHAINIFDDMLGCGRTGRNGELQSSMRMIEQEGRGVVVVIRDAAPRALSEMVRQREGGEAESEQLRDYGIGAQILLDLGVKEMVLLSNTKRTIVGLDGYGLTVVGQRPIQNLGRARMADIIRVLLVEAPYYRHIADELRAGAIEALMAAGAVVDTIQVPGAFEIPGAIALAAGLHLPADRRLAQSYDGYVALGCVIRGETTHYDYVCGESARGLQELVLRHGLAIGFGILTTENGDQAWARAQRDKKNKGAEAANAALAMIALRQQLWVKN